MRVLILGADNYFVEGVVPVRTATRGDHSPGRT
jgi:hypothetical protein